MQAKSLRKSLITILERYKKYEKYLQYPGDWGERAFRGWLVYEIFHDQLQWPIPNIVFGERFDVLFVDGAVKPVIYLETKKPGRVRRIFQTVQHRNGIPTGMADNI